MRLRRPRRHDAARSETERRYRYLLLTADRSSLVALHAWAMRSLSIEDRGRVLDVCQRRLVVGLRTRPDDSGAMARIAVLAEKRRAGQFRRALPPDLLAELAAGVVDSAMATTLLEGYAAWDGREPEPPPEPEPDRDLHTNWEQARVYPGPGWTGLIRGGPAA